MQPSQRSSAPPSDSPRAGDGESRADSAMNSATLASWVQAVGVLAAFAVTGGALIREMRLSRLARESALADRQARYVSCWTAGWDVTIGTAAISYRNGSQEPVYAVALRAAASGGSDSVDREKEWTSVGTLAPNKERSVDLPFERIGDPVSELPAGLPVEMAFRDSAGVWWLRSSDGRLGLRHGAPI